MYWNVPPDALPGSALKVCLSTHGCLLKTLRYTHVHTVIEA